MAEEGLSNSAGSGSQVFVSIMGGKFRVKAKEGDEGAIERTKQTGDKVWEHVYSSLIGYITHVGTKEVPFDPGHILEVVITTSSGKEYKVSLPYYKNQALSFLKKIPNVNPAEKVQLSVWNVTESRNGKDVTSTVFNVSQVNEEGEWKTVPAKYRKGEEGKCPPWRKIPFQGKEVWDNSDQFHWLIENEAVAYQHKLKDIKFPSAVGIPEELQESEDDFDVEAEAAKAEKAKAKSKKTTKKKEPEPSVLDDEEDDLPF